MKRNKAAALLALLLCCAMSGCGEKETEEVLSPASTTVTETETQAPTEISATTQTSAPQTSTEAAVTTTTVTEATTTAPPETQATKQTTVEETTVAETEAQTEAPTDTMHADMQSYSAPAYACMIEIPAGWSASDGVLDGAISDMVSVFQPDSPNGDSIALLIEDAEEAATFASMSESTLTEAYAQSLSSVTVTMFDSITVDGYPAYRTAIAGEVSDITVEITQLFLNSADHLYVLTYTNASDSTPVYTDAIETYFHLT